MTTDRPEDFRGTARERTSKVLFMEFVQKQPSGSFLFFVLRHIIKCVITVQLTINMKCPRCVEGHGGKKKLMFPSGRKSKERSAIVPTRRIDFFKALSKRGRACCNSVANCQTNGMDASQIRTLSTDGANRKKFRGDGVVWSCCGTLKGMGSRALRVASSGCTYRPNKTQHRNRVDLDITQSLNQTFGSFDFHHALHNFSGCSPTMKVTIRANHCSNIFGVSNNLHLTELIAILGDPCLQRIMLFVAILNPTAFVCDNLN